MPVIVYKTLTLETVHAQVRRIVCDSCGGPFSYVIGDAIQTQTAGLPLVSGDEGMRKAAFNQALKKLAGIARKKNRGQALCPHCKSYQQFMVGASVAKCLAWGIGLGLVIGGLGAFFTSMFLDFPVDGLLSLGGGAVLGAVIGGVIGKMRALTAGPHQELEDGRAMDDERFRQHLDDCKKEDFDPALAWFFMLGYEHNPQWLLISLGIDDRTGNPISPDELSTRTVLSQLK